MPSPVSHLFYAQHVLPPDEPADLAAYHRGAVFPDIRYLGVIERARSHRTGVTVYEIKRETDPWQRGNLVHNWTDEVWSGYWSQLGFDTDESSHRAHWMAVKLVEDELLFADIFDKPGIAASLAHADDGAISFGVKGRDVEHWGRIVGSMVTQAPGPDCRSKLYHELDLGFELGHLIETQAKVIKADTEWMERVRGCHQFVLDQWGQ